MGELMRELVNSCADFVQAPSAELYPAMEKLAEYDHALIFEALVQRIDEESLALRNLPNGGPNGLTPEVVRETVLAVQRADPEAIVGLVQGDQADGIALLLMVLAALRQSSV
ncbi:hypothetical protein [Nesterenkonia muleiensis]|uniref:hypothetical protein n=1 Tax=Nesterenkonia muleiensis TaxID=2282648 RepID=UPI000E7128C8|nr:hypothetical protein [Nesterenkonia muleiensis]